MFKKVSAAILIMILAVSAVSLAQNLDGKSFDPEVDADIDMYIGSWKESMPKHTHGSFIERDILTKGDAMNPPNKGAVLEYINRFTYATLESRASTVPTTLNGEQEIFYILSGQGEVTAGGKTADLYESVAVFIPAELEFTVKNTGDEPLTMYLINEPIPAGFRPNKYMMVKDENALPVSSTGGHWVHIVKGLFGTNDGLGTLESVITVSFDPMTIGHPHSHVEGVEEVWTAITGSSIAFIGKEIRMQHPGTGYMIPPDGKTPHGNINDSKKQTKMLYFARYRDHGVRK
ncbi:cupin domain-containing protein [Candidatus Latescibacterota bacterium]